MPATRATAPGRIGNRYLPGQARVSLHGPFLYAALGRLRHPMAHCPHCSTHLLPDQDVCPGCGRDVAEADETPDPLIGATLAGKYHILEPIGEGAMGRVYRARQLALDKLVAIKVLHRHLATDPKVARRFHREARAAARLSHPHSLQILDFGEAEDGILYIAMELLDGCNLLEIVERESPLTPARIRNICDQILSALHAAHEAGIIHRDLKPENVIVVRRGAEEIVKVCDFGIAKIQEQEGGSAITVRGFVCGTPEFMAPEQARGEELDRRADIYAAGCLLYQLLTGEMPFVAESALGVITKHLTEQPVPPRRRRPEWNIPESLERVTLRAMAKRREDRFADAPAMAEAIDRAVEALGARADEPLGRAAGTIPARRTTRARSSAGRSAVAASSEVRLPVSRGRRWWIGALAAAAAAGLLVVGLRAGSGGSIAAGPGPQSASRSASQEQTPVPDGAQTVSSPSREARRMPETIATALDAATPQPVGELERPENAAATSDRRPRREERPATRRPAHAGDRNERTTTQRTDEASSGPVPGGGSDDPEPSPPHPSTSPPEAPSSPDPVQQALTRGRQSLVAGDVRAAIEAFEHAARLAPRNAEVHKQLGRAYMRAGDADRGRQAYRRYLELAPDAPDRAFIERTMQGN
ncbi:MAG: protein kinase [Myxococcota bacterium]|nr:protein kinase [Myxococcota bacterium]